MCEKFDCTARTLRHYEEIELLFPQKEGRSRWYGKREIARMKLIMRGRRFGFPLEGIRQWLLMYDGDKSNIDQINAWIEMATNQIEELKSKRMTLDQSIEEASMDLGETAFGTFRRIILPMVAPGLMASFIIGFTISLDEFMIAFFLTGTEPTLPVYIWAQFRFPVKLPSVMALGTILLIFSLLLLSLSEFFRRRISKSGALEIV